MSEFIESVMKIKYIQEGYLPDFPYYLISRDELIDAFFSTSQDSNDEFIINPNDYFHQNYFLPDGFESLQSVYDVLHNTIQRLLFEWKKLNKSSVNSTEVTIDNVTYQLVRDELPNWIYSYMLHSVICDSSNQRDKHDLLELLQTPNMVDEFTLSAATKCKQISEQWIAKLPLYERRPVTIFGEPHVIKSLRLQLQGQL